LLQLLLPHRWNYCPVAGGWLVVLLLQLHLLPLCKGLVWWLLLLFD
jgi:hypothetical protein